MASIQLSRYEAEEGDLPDVCMCCGRAATERKRRRFISHPLLVYLLLPWGYIFYAIVAAILTEHIRCYTLFCPRTQELLALSQPFHLGFANRLLVLLVGGFVLAGSLSGKVSRSTEDVLFGSLCIGSVVLLLCWFMSIPISQVTAIHPANATKNHLTLKRISPAFVEAVRQNCANRKDESRADDYREHFRSRRSPPRHRDRDDDRFERS